MVKIGAFFSGSHACSFLFPSICFCHLTSASSLSIVGDISLDMSLYKPLGSENKIGWLSEGAFEVSKDQRYSSCGFNSNQAFVAMELFLIIIPMAGLRGSFRMVTWTSAQLTD